MDYKSIHFSNLLLLLTFVTWDITYAQEKKEKVKIQQWDSRFIQSSGEALDQFGSTITAVLFDNVLNQKIRFGEEEKRGIIEIKRAVYDNQDISQTWTVIDRIGFSIESAKSIPLLTYPVASLNLRIGAGAKIEIENYNIIESKYYKTYPTLQELALDAENTQSTILNNELYYDYDPSIRARISNIFNPLLETFKIPLTLKKFNKLKKGELISYSTIGHLMVGLNAGFIPLKLKDNLNLDVLSAKVLTKGQFKITVLKENERFAKVKVTKINSVEKNFEMGSGRPKLEVHEGFVLFEGRQNEIETKPIKVAVVPFKFNFIDNDINTFDIGYRFDLKTHSGRSAYLKAVKGNFSEAEEFALVDQGVEHLLSRKSDEKRKQSFYTLGIDSLFKQKFAKDFRDFDIVIEDKNGYREIFKSSYELSRSWSTLWGRKESKKFLFTSLFNKTKFVNKKNDYMNLLFEGLIEDNHTNSPEMEEYLKQVKIVLGEKKLLPSFEEISLNPDPEADEDSRLNLTRNFSSSTFYFGQSFTHEQILKFINTSNSKAWKVCQQAFEYIVDQPSRERMISQFFEHWMDIKSSFRAASSPEDIIKISKDLRKLFNRHSKIIYALATITFALDGEETDYFLTATNKTFGRIQLRGKTITNIEQLIQETDDEFKFRSPVVQFSTDPELLVNNLKFNQVNRSRLDIQLNLSDDVKYIFFKVYRHNSLRTKIMEEFVYVNKDRFKKGENKWSIFLDTTDELDQAILNSFTKNDYYTIQVSVSRDRITWGRLASDTFYFIKPGSEEE